MKSTTTIFRRVYRWLLCLSLACTAGFAQMPRHPILFVTVVPTANDSANQASVICNHLGSSRNALRGGDLWIRYANGHLRNLTRAAGFGSDSLQTENSIAVRQPCVHWDGTRALFSMAVGAPSAAHPGAVESYWQIYEIRDFAESQTPVINKVPNQMQANNVSPLYGTDDRIIFSSDKQRHPWAGSGNYLDESQGMPVPSALWSMDPTNGEYHQLDCAPSGDYNASIDSYGRVVFSRWDILQQDQLPALTGGQLAPYTYNCEDHCERNYTLGESVFPEHNDRLVVVRDVPKGGGYFSGPIALPGNVDNTGVESTLFDPRLPSDFFPWSMNEDGSDLQTINHIGRQDMRDTIPVAPTADKNIHAFSARQKTRPNNNALINVLQLHEDPTHAGRFYAIDAPVALTHGGGQIVVLDNLSPSHASRDLQVSYITPRETRFFVTDSAQPPAAHTGFYRNPLPTSDGLLLASHAQTTRIDNQAQRASGFSRFDYRLHVLASVGQYMVPGPTLTDGIRKVLVYYDSAAKKYTPSKTLTLWEMEACEVVQRTRPHRREQDVDSLEKKVFEEEGVDLSLFRHYLESKRLALVVTRDLTQRDSDDHQQPFYLRVRSTAKQTVGAKDSVYEISSVDFFQGDYLRGHAINGIGELPGVRVYPLPMHDVKNRRPDSASTRFAASNSVHIADDASMAALVPAGRGISWQLSSSRRIPVVRERYWLSFAPGEIRTCVRCHGENQSAAIFSQPPPQNKAEALRGLLHVWQQDNIPATVALTSPANNSIKLEFPLLLTWKRDSLATSYDLTIRAQRSNDSRVVLTEHLVGNVTSYTLSTVALQADENDIVWEVRANNEWGSSSRVNAFRFTTSDHFILDVRESESSFELSPNPAYDHITITAPSSETIQSVTMFGSCGSQIHDANLVVVPGKQHMTLPLPPLSDGVYHVVIQTEARRVRKTLIIVR